ncbi:MAG TPA: glycosyltransferase family 1 protein [Candidatus Angelobacter sp.]|nr:glycosyltransferase family 1 protein [Candidatus Angelobacter sp.]
MKIAFDPWTLSARFRHQGTYVYARNLMAQFQRLHAGGSGKEVTFNLFASPASTNDARLVESSNGFQLVRTNLPNYDRLWRFGGVSLAAARARADVIFAPTASIFPIGAIPVICTIHDATAVMMPSHSRKVRLLSRALLWASATRSSTVIAVSEHTRNDLIRIYGLPESRVAVVYNGYDKTVFNETASDPESKINVLKKLGLSRPYILHHGTIQPRKNLKRLIQAYRLMFSRNPNLDLDLVLVGQPGWEYEEIVAMASQGNPGDGRVVLTGILDDADLAAVIKGASLVVIPSLYEGFCLPMVEAMACGAPVVAANASCLPEISGGCLKYFDPHSMDEIAACMEQVLENGELRTSLSRKGIERAQFFSWERCAAETLNLLKSQVVKGKAKS